jgi:hypothetical protein
MQASIGRVISLNLDSRDRSRGIQHIILIAAKKADTDDSPVQATSANVYKSMLRIVHAISELQSDRREIDVQLGDDGVLWLHAIIAAFMKGLPFLFGSLSFCSALQALSESLQDVAFASPVVSLGAIGHLATILGAGVGVDDVSEFSNSALALWRIPKDILTTPGCASARRLLLPGSKYNFKRFNINLAVASASRALLRLDISQSTKSPSYASFSGLLRLMIHTGTIDVRDVSKLSFNFADTTVKGVMESSAHSLLHLRSNLAADNLEEVLRITRELHSKGVELNGVNTVLADARRCFAIWTAAREAVLHGHISRSQAIAALEQQLHPPAAVGVAPIDAPARRVIVEQITSLYDEVRS